jgi:hypothetical protein
VAMAADRVVTPEPLIGPRIDPAVDDAVGRRVLLQRCGFNAPGTEGEGYAA